MLLIVIALAAPTRAFADAKSDADQHVARATEAHRSGRYAEALTELNLAYEIEPRPELLFAIGQIHVLLKRCQEAITYYARFLATHPEPGPAEAARESIDQCRREAVTPPRAEAKQHIDRAALAHKEGRYPEALDELNLAYRIEPRPDLVFAIAQIHVLLGKCSDAITLYERFLATRPDQDAAAWARESIDTCKRELVVPAKPEPPPEPPPVKPPPPTSPMVDDPQPFYKDPLGGVFVGGGIALSIVALLQYRGALDDLDRADQPSSLETHVRLVDDAHTKRTRALLFGAGGIALVGAGIVRYVIHARATEARGVAIISTQGGGILTWSDRF